MNTKLNLLACTLGLLLAATLPGTAQIDTTKLGQIDVVSVDRAHVITTNGNYVIQIDVTFENRNAESLKLRGVDYRLGLESPASKAGSPVAVGHGKLEELVIPGRDASNANRGTVVARLEVEVGPRNETTTERVIEVLNLLADPAEPIGLRLTGTSQIGLQLPRGWAFEVGKRYEVDLGYEPTLRRNLAVK